MKGGSMREGFCKTVTAMVIGAASALGVGIPWRF
jgi:hypothetical protein